MHVQRRKEAVLAGAAACAAALAILAAIATTPSESTALTSCGGGGRPYAALGDSIVTGATGWPPDPFGWGSSYADRFQGNHLGPLYGTYLVNLAENGDTSWDLLQLLRTDATLRYWVSRACVITICIGGNNLLRCAGWPFYSDFGSSELSCASYGANRFASDWPQILAELDKLNPNAARFVMTVYNPFRDQNVWWAWNDRDNHRRLEPYLHSMRNTILYWQAAGGYDIGDAHVDWHGTSGGTYRVCNYTNMCNIARDPHPTGSGDAQIAARHASVD